MDAKQLTSEQEAVDQLREEINAVMGKRWMVAIWCAEGIVGVEQNGIFKQSSKQDLVVLSNRTTWRFPQGGFEEAVNLLRENLEVEQKTDVLSVPSPLEMAPFVMPVEDESEVDDEKCSELSQDDGTRRGEKAPKELLLGDMLRKNREGE